MNDNANAVLEKSYAFALRVIRLATLLQRENEFVLSRQLVRSGTSVGANVEEAQAAQTKPDFHTIPCRAAKEARETHYWLRLIRDSYPQHRTEAAAQLELAQELKRILGAITKTTSGKS